jgi:hypothetical protein
MPDRRPTGTNGAEVALQFCEGWDSQEHSMDSVVQQDRVDMTEAEWQARCDLAALYRITDLYGWTDTINTHMSVRIPGEPNCFQINNYGD